MTATYSSIRTRSKIRNGFTFAEIMFAVMILGVGFIMVAAMFPVAIRQTQTSVENLNGVAEAKRGAALLSQLGTAFSGYVNVVAAPYTNLTLTTQVASPNQLAGAPLYTFFTAPVGGNIPYNYIKGDIINQLDHRFAWFPVAYQVDLRAIGANTPIPESALVYLVAVEKRNPDQAEYTTTDRDSGSPDSIPPTAPVEDGAFKPKQVYFKLIEGQDPNTFGAVYPDTIVFTNSAGSTQMDEPAADTGAYVWVADDKVVTAVTATTGPHGQYAYQPGTANGRYYRLGPKVSGQTGVWELDPAKDMQITTNPGPDGIYGNTDDLPPVLENLPPRPYDSSQPYSSGNYSSVLSTGSPALGLLVGKSLRDPTKPYSTSSTPPNLYVGTAQPIFALPPIAVTLKNQ